MKKILLSLTLILLGFISFSQSYPCPFTYKSNQGGGGCAKNISACTQDLTSSITLTYSTTAPPSLPTIVSISDPNGPYNFACFSATFLDAPTNKVVRLCFYTNNGKNDNFFNSRNSITLNLFYTVNGSPTPTQACIVIPDNIPTPVSFTSFTAARNHSVVALKWVTASEQNNSGFSVQRNTRGVWEEVAFVPSQAAGGNSDAVLTYTLSDLNNERGISQYRIKQIDIDAKFSYTEIRAVRGEGQVGKTTVYPNPSSNGRVNVVFEDGTVSREVSVMDMSGRMVKQYRGITNNNITIDNLTPGMYSIRIFVPATGEQVVEKIVVNKR